MNKIESLGVILLESLPETFFFFAFYFLDQHSLHMEVPRLGVE